MLPKLISAYKEMGYKVDLGNGRRLYSIISDRKTQKPIFTSGGFTVSDAFFFMQLERLVRVDSCFVIGNAFGLSTFVLAELFPEAMIDAIDAESEGIDARQGSIITRAIAAKHFPRVQLTIGFSPQDITKAARLGAYGIIFIDGKHTNEQMKADYDGIINYCGDKCIMVFHDVAYANLISAWSDIVEKSKPLGFSGYKLAYTQLGTCVLVRGLREVSEFLEDLSADFDGPYRTSLEDDSGKNYGRPYFWDWSFSYIERMAKRKTVHMLLSITRPIRRMRSGN